MTLSLRRAHGLDDCLDRDHGLFRLGATTVIRVHMSGADLATRGDGISCRHREGPAVVAVVDRQIDLERSVDAFEIIWQPERQPERGCHRVTRVREQIKGQRVFCHERPAVLRKLG